MTRTLAPSTAVLGPRRARAWLAVVVPMVFAIDGGPASSSFASGPTREERDEYDLKTAMLFNMMRYSRWPRKAFPDRKAPFEIAVVGKDPYGKRLERTFGGKKFSGRNVVIRRYASSKAMKNPQLVVLGGLEDKERDAVLEKTREKPILVVGEQPGICKRGAVFRVYMKEGRLAFKASKKAVKDCGLRIGSDILKHAEIVD